MITLYTTHCPKCRVLEKKLAQKNVQYNEITDVSEMQKLGIKSAPVLEVDGKKMNQADAIRWLMNQ